MVQAEGGEVRAERERGEIRVGHSDDAEEAEEAEAVRRGGHLTAADALAAARSLDAAKLVRRAAAARPVEVELTALGTLRKGAGLTQRGSAAAAARAPAAAAPPAGPPGRGGGPRSG